MATDDSVYRLAQLTTWWARPFDAGKAQSEYNTTDIAPIADIGGVPTLGCRVAACAGR
jgi:hypothetical protein